MTYDISTNPPVYVHTGIGPAERERIASETLRRLKAEDHKRRRLSGKTLADEFDEFFGVTQYTN